MKKVKIGGWKTKASAAALMLIGVAGVLQGAILAASGDFESGMTAVKGGVASIAGGLGLLGIGHKAEKVKALLEK